jgi:lipopolysaccharide biosynthesis regulator YciM
MEINPDVVGIHASLGRVLAHQGRLADAVAAVRRASELAPDNQHIQHQLDVLTKRYEQSESVADAANGATATHVAEIEVAALPVVASAQHPAVNHLPPSAAKPRPLPEQRTSLWGRLLGRSGRGARSDGADAR